jgi:branched-chain amino acid aminotransferase
MAECLGNHFICNGSLISVKQFDASFLSRPHYIYEVFRVIDGVALFLEDHLARLEQTCILSKHCLGFNHAEITKNVYELIHSNSLRSGNIKIVISQDTEMNNDLMIYITEHQYPSDEQFRTGVGVALQKGIRHNPNAKVMDVKLRSEANLIKNNKDVYETLLVDENGCITEGSRSNVFFIRNGKVITPPLEDVLPGITRKHVSEVCKVVNIPLVEEKVLARSVVVMEAVFISGTSRKVLPVNRIDEVEFDPDHPITRQIQEGFNQRVEVYVRNHK